MIWKLVAGMFGYTYTGDWKDWKEWNIGQILGQENQEDREEEERKEEEENYEFLGNKNEILILSVSFFYAEIQLTKRPSRVTHSPKLTLHSHATSSWLGSTRRAMLTQWMEEEHSPLQWRS